MSERYTYQPRPEYFEGTHTVEDIMAEYEQLAEKATKDHELRFAHVATSHELAFTTEAQNPGSQNIEDVMASTEQAVQDASKLVVPEVQRIITAAGVSARGTLSPHDNQVLSAVYETIELYGVGSYTVERAMDRASSPAARKAMHISSDELLLAKVKEGAKLYGAGSYSIEKMLDKASSLNVRAAMKATLDGMVLNAVHEGAELYGPGGYTLQRTLNAASTPAIRAAMQATLDSRVLKKAKEDAGLFGADSYSIGRTLDAASSASVRQVFARTVGTDSAQSWKQQENFGYKASQQNFNAEDIFTNYFKNQRRQDRQTRTNSRQTGTGGNYGNGYRQQQSARREAPPRRPEKDTEVEQVVGRVVSGDRQYGWLRSEDPKDVRRVINTVRAARKSATDKGRELSDREIYLRYRRLADKGESSGHDIADPALVKSFKILDAMMGGNIRGKLPF
ncbi:MAG TPA: hypothetical protein VK978_01945 [Candidatus Saccharimonadales bacterium]|nr:hypothetical protein [Candidatus Saccharimonadales bacterium]